MTVAVVSCVYGATHRRFIERWADAVRALHPAPDDLIVATDTYQNIPGARTIECFSDWKHPQAYYLQRAVTAADTDWVVVADIDDVLHPDALRGIDEVAADVWQFGFVRSDAEVYLPPRLTPAEFLSSDKNVYVGSSAIRTDIFHDCGGYPDVALQDWGLWRRLARHGAVVEPSIRTHFTYMRHPQTRGKTELTAAARAEHLAEMMETELAYA